MTQTNSVGQDITDVAIYEAQRDEIRRDYPSIRRLERYINERYEAAENSDSKKDTEKARLLAFRAEKIKHNFIETMRNDDYANLKRREMSHEWRSNLYPDDPLEIKLKELEGFFIRQFDTLMEDKNLSENEMKQKGLIREYTIKNYIHLSRRRWMADWANESALYERHIEALINIRGWGGSKESLKGYKGSATIFPPHLEDRHNYATFRRIFNKFKEGIGIKVNRRKLTREEYEYLINTPTEELFYEVVEKTGLSLRK